MLTLDPQVTCLMVTRQRPAMARRSIEAFLNQDYANRDLLIVADGGAEDQEISSFVRARQWPNVRVIDVPLGSKTLGALRNLSVDKAFGEYVCQWDDDDLYHPARLSRQMRCLRGRQQSACFLADQLYFLSAERQLFWCDWSRARDNDDRAGAIPNTLLCRRDRIPRYQESGPTSIRSEDMDVMVKLLASRDAVVLRGAGTSYVYVNHGSNTWDDGHFRRIATATGLGSRELLAKESVLRDELRLLRLDTPLDICAYDGRVIYSLGPDGTLSLRAP